jgi:hypothetical protein
VRLFYCRRLIWHRKADHRAFRAITTIPGWRPVIRAEYDHFANGKFARTSGNEGEQYYA